MPRKARPPGSALLSVNSAGRYYDVRVKPIHVLAGRELVVTVMPTVHNGSEAFRALSRDRRLCLFQDEDDVRID